MVESEIVKNLSKTLGLESGFLFYSSIIVLICVLVLIIAFILDSKEVSGFNFDAIRFRSYLKGVKSLNWLTENLNILKIQALVKGRPSITSTNAQIIQLAHWGYIKIKKDNQKIEILKTLKSPDDLPAELYMFYNFLFGDKSSISNERKLIDNEKKNENIKLAKNLERLFKELSVDFEDEGLYKDNSKTIIIAIKAVALFFLFSGTPLFARLIVNSGEQLLLIPFFIAYVILLLTILLIGRKSFFRIILSEKGREYLKEIQGLYLYIKTAEVDRINFHTNPKEYKNSFMDLLPYALLFGMSDKWLRYLPLQTSDWGGDIWEEDLVIW
jgi:hypothetical protein